MSEYIFVTNIFKYSNIWIYSSHSVRDCSRKLPVISWLFSTVCHCLKGQTCKRWSFKHFHSNRCHPRPKKDPDEGPRRPGVSLSWFLSCISLSWSLACFGSLVLIVWFNKLKLKLILVLSMFWVVSDSELTSELLGLCQASKYNQKGNLCWKGCGAWEVGWLHVGWFLTTRYLAD